MLIAACIRPSQRRGAEPAPDFNLQHIDTGSAKPLFDVVGYGFLLAYALAWPTEYAHYKHEQEAKLKGAAAH